MNGTPPDIPHTTVGAAFCLDCPWDYYVQDELHLMARAHAGAAAHRAQVAITRVWAYQPAVTP